MIKGVRLFFVWLWFLSFVLVLGCFESPQDITAKRERDVLAYLHHLVSVESMYLSKNSHYGRFEELTQGPRPYLAVAGSAFRYQYKFKIEVLSDPVRFFIVAQPQDTVSDYSYYINDQDLACKSKEPNSYCPKSYSARACPVYFEEVVTAN
ncbi:MAG: hypothetical protein PHV17_09320 [Candidatus Omnitrophica bacterium]|nr:hypothetical protein [Candidatus Omnitrophota bacterium]